MIGSAKLPGTRRSDQGPGGRRDRAVHDIRRDKETEVGVLPSAELLSA